MLSEPVAKESLHSLRVSALSGAAHDLSGEEAQQPGFACAVAVHLVGVLGEHGIHGGRERCVVADGREAAGFDDRFGATAFIDERGDHFARRRPRDRLRPDEPEHIGERFRRRS